MTVWAVVPWEVPDFEEANANCDNSSQVQDAVLNLKVCILMSLINILERPSLSLPLLHGCNPYPVSVSGKLRFRDFRELSGRPQVLRCGNFQNWALQGRARFIYFYILLYTFYILLYTFIYLQDRARVVASPNPPVLQDSQALLWLARCSQMLWHLEMTIRCEKAR